MTVRPALSDAVMRRGTLLSEEVFHIYCVQSVVLGRQRAAKQIYCSIYACVGMIKSCSRASHDLIMSSPSLNLLSTPGLDPLCWLLQPRIITYAHASCAIPSRAHNNCTRQNLSQHAQRTNQRSPRPKAHQQPFIDVLSKDDQESKETELTLLIAATYLCCLACMHTCCTGLSDHPSVLCRVRGT